MFDWFKKLFSKTPRPASQDVETTQQSGEQNATSVTKPCQSCGKPITFDPSWKHIPNYCKECKKKFQEERGLTSRKCKGCGKTFTFPKDLKHYPNYCRECQRKHKKPKA